MTEHTALPWKIRVDTGEYGTYHFIGDIGGDTVGEREDIDQANARFIVTACNCHAELLEVVKSVAILCKCHCHALKAGYTCYVCEAREAARNAEEQT